MIIIATNRADRAIQDPTDISESLSMKMMFRGSHAPITTLHTAKMEYTGTRGASFDCSDGKDVHAAAVEHHEEEV